MALKIIHQTLPPPEPEPPPCVALENTEKISHHTVILVEDDPGFSMRKLARNLDMSLGNLQYHFPTRGDGLEGLLTARRG